MFTCNKRQQTNRLFNQLYFIQQKPNKLFSNMSSKRKTESKNEGPDSKVKKPSKLWTLGLVDSMNDPELQIKSDDLVVVIKDKFPKAKFHYLVLPKENINDLKKLKSEHVELLQHMEEMGREVVEDEKHSGSNFRFGFHARASMQRLHLHVISDDMVSPCLKNKKHWNTFTTDFFLNAESKFS